MKSFGKIQNNNVIYFDNFKSISKILFSILIQMVRMKLTWKRIMLSSNEVFVNISLLFKLKFLLLQGPISRCEIIRFKWEDLKANYLFSLTMI